MKVVKKIALLVIGLLAGLHQAAALNFASAVDYYAPTNALVYTIAAADVNGDGAKDIICANGNTNTITILTNNGNGVFGSNATYVVGDQPYCVTAADLRGLAKWTW